MGISLASPKGRTAVRRSSALTPLVLLLAASLVATSVLARAVDLDRVVAFRIESQPLDSALLQFSKQANIQVVVAPDIDGTAAAPAINGPLSARVALDTLLRHTGLKYAEMDKSISVTREGVAPAFSPPSSAGSATPSGSNTTAPDQGGDHPAAQPSVTNSPSDRISETENSRNRPGALQEVIVTAQKREERLSDVPVPVTAISAPDLVEGNQVRLQDWYNRVPSLNEATDQYGAARISIRGLTAGSSTSPTVGIVIDDVPFGPTSSLALGQEVPDIDPDDLARVEVLRGPQGTLYGASSLGGLIKFVTVDPSPEELTGRVQAGTSYTHNGAELGYNVRGSVNVPISPTLAVRASGFARQDPGYIDNPILHIDGVNEGHAAGGRLAALWELTDGLSLRLSALLQHTKIDGAAYVDVPSSAYPQTAGLGDLQQNNARDTGWYDKTSQAYSGTLKAKLGNDVDLTSLSGYNVNRLNDSFDGSYVYGSLVTKPLFGVTGSPVINNLTTRKFTQEVRLSAPIGQRVEWLLGGFYDYEDTKYTQDTLATNFASGALAGQLLHSILPSTFTEYAAFADLTFHLTEQFDVQVGGRESRNRQTYAQTSIGPYDEVFLHLPSPVIYPDTHANDSSFTYLVTPRFKVTPNLMVYSRLASGYRPGGPNSALLSGEVPQSYRADKTENYEIGAKADALDHMLSFDTSVYYIDWKDIQLDVTDPTTNLVYRTNGSRAKSQGIEVSIEARPVQGLTVTAWSTWNDAELTKSLPPGARGTVVGMPGDRLPFSSRYSGNLSLEQRFPIVNDLTGFVAGTLSYIGERESVFRPTRVRQIFPAYATTDARAGLQKGTWTVDIYANNVVDRRGVLNGGTGFSPPFGFVYIQPRTVGLSVGKEF